MNDQELTIFIITKLKQALACGKGIYNPKLHKMLPTKTLNPEILNKMAINHVIFSYKGYYFFNPEFKNKTDEEILSHLKP